MRGLFSAFVVFWHVVGYTRTIPDWMNVPGRISVWMFFGISGYVIGYGFFRGRHQFSGSGLQTFALRRMARILPIFWTLSLVAVALLLWRGEPLPFDWFEGFKQLFAFKWRHDYSLVGVFWTLGIEVQFYLIAPLICYAILSSPQRGPFVIIAVWTFLVLALGSDPDNRTTIAAMQHFLAGMFIARISNLPGTEGLLDSPVLRTLALIIGLASLAVASRLYHNDEVLFWSYRGGLLTDLAIASLLFAHCSFERLKIEPNGITKIFLVLGVLSYGLYAWHGLLLIYFPWFHNSLFATFLASMVLAFLSYKFVERPVHAAVYR